MQIVDPFVPVKRKRPQPRQRSSDRAKARHHDIYTVRKPQLAQTKPPSIIPRPLAKTPNPPSAKTPEPPPVPLQANQPFATAIEINPKKPGRLKRIGAIAGQIIIFAGLLAIGFFARSVIIGQILIIIYAVFAFVMKIESRTTYILALMSLAVVLVASLRADSGLASAFAVYAFLLLVIGTLCLGREVRSEL